MYLGKLKIAFIITLVLLVSLLTNIAFAKDFDWGGQTYSATLYTDSGFTNPVTDSTYTYDALPKQPYVKLMRGSTQIATDQYTYTWVENVNANDAFIEQETTVGDTVTHSGKAFAVVTYTIGENTFTGYVPFTINRMVINSSSPITCTVAGSKLYDGAITYPQIITSTYTRPDNSTFDLQWNQFNFDGTDQIDVIEGGIITGQANVAATELLNVGVYYVAPYSTNYTNDPSDPFVIYFYVFPRAITCSWTGDSFSYDGSSHVSTPTFSTGVSGQTITTKDTHYTLTGDKTNAGTGYTAKATVIDMNITSSAYDASAFPIVIDGDSYTLGEFVLYSNYIQAEEGSSYTQSLVDTFADTYKTSLPAGYTPEYASNAIYDYLDSNNIVKYDDEDYLDYSFTHNFDITKATITVTATNKEVEKNSAWPITFEYTNTNGVNGEVPAFTGALSTTATGTGTTGTYDIIQGNLALADNSPFLKDNYDLAYNKGTLTISSSDITILASHISDPQNYVYDGTAKEPPITVTVGGVTLTKGTHYNVTYTCNTQVNGQETTAPTVTVTAIEGSGYTGSASKTFNITPAPMTITWNDKDTFYYDGKEHIRVATVATGVTGETAVFTIVTPQVDVDDYTATVNITGITGGKANLNNYTLPTNTTNTFHIIELPIDTPEPTDDPEDPQDPDPIDPTNPDYTVEVVVTWPDETYEYDGTAKEPKPTVQLIIKDSTGEPVGNPTTLVENEDYTVSYGAQYKNVDAGSFTATVTCTGNVTGTSTHDYTISPKPIAYNWKNREFIYDGRNHVAYAEIETGVTGETINFSVITPQSAVGDNYPAEVPTTSESVTGGRANINNYVISNRTTTFDIKPVDLEEADPEGDPGGQEGKDGDNDVIVKIIVTLEDAEYTYDGTEKQPNIVKVEEVVYDKETGDVITRRDLVEGTDYDKSYVRNINAKDKTADDAPAVVITGKGDNYTNSLEVPFTIKPAVVTIVWNDKDTFQYDGKEHIRVADVTTSVAGKTVQFTIGDKQIDANPDGETYTATVTITGITDDLLSNYTLPDNYTAPFIIVTLPIEEEKPTDDPEDPEDPTPIPDTPGDADYTVEVVVTWPDGPFEYDGTEHKPEPTVQLIIIDKTTGQPIGEPTTLVKDEDYTITYGDPYDNVDAGDFTATLTGTGPNITGTVTQDYTINPKPIAYEWTNREFIYDGRDHVAFAEIETGVTGETINFSVVTAQSAVGDNYPAEVPTTSESVTGGRANINNYVISNRTSTFDIKPVDLEEADPEGDPGGQEGKDGDNDVIVKIIVTLEDAEYTYDGTEKQPNIVKVEEVVYDKETGDEITRRELVEGTDYDKSYKRNINAKDKTADDAPVVVITGKGNNYTNELEVPFTIKPAVLTIEWNEKDTFQYDGKEHIRVAEVTTTTGKVVQYTITDKQINANGDGEYYTATIVITGIEDDIVDNYTLPDNYTNTFRIVTLPISEEKATDDPEDPEDPTPIDPADPDFTVEVIVTWPDETYTYDGTPKEPKPEVTLIIKDAEGNPQGDPVTLTEGVDYEITYGPDNVNAGDFTATLTGIGTNITGTSTHDYTIDKAKLTVTADNKTKYIGKDLPELTYKVTGAANGETPAFNGELETNATNDSPKGTYDIYCDGKLEAIENGTFNPNNYEIEYKDGKLTVKNKPIASDPTPSTPNEKVVDLAVDLRSGSPDEDKGNPNHYKLGEEVIYWVDYINGGDKITGKKVYLVLEIPLDFTILDSDGGKVDYNKRTITWEFNGMDKNEGGTKEVHLKYTKFSKDGITQEDIYPYAKILLVNDLKDDSAVHNIIYTEGVELKTNHKVYMWGDLDTPTFRPTDYISRAEGAMVLLRIFDISYQDVTVKGTEFPDLDETYDQAQKAIVKATELGLVNGYEDGTYRPNNKMTRGEFMKLIAVYVEHKAKEDGIKGINLDDTKTVTKYAAQNNWTNKYVTLLNRLNLTPISAKNPDLLVDEKITRAEVAQLCNLYLMRAPVKDDGKIELPFEDVDKSTALWGDIAEATRPSHEGYDLSEDTYEIWDYNEWQKAYEEGFTNKVLY